MLISEFKRADLIDWDVFPHQKATVEYLHRLSADELLKAFYTEAGLCEPVRYAPTDYEGWEYISCAIRGHFTGHYLSALAMAGKYCHDTRLAEKARYITDEMIKCQTENGGQWIMAFPEKNLNFLLKNKNYRVPVYVIHKVMMGLIDVWKYLGYAPAKDAVIKMADYLYDWSGKLSEEEMRSVINFESGGITEVLGEVYYIAKEEKYKVLAERFVRRDLFDRLIEGVDCLTNMHANTTAPEAVGIARLYEITGDEYYRKAAEAYYDCAIRKRGYFVTGGNNSGECYIPPYRQLARMGDMVQEHCTSYNLVRLADFLFRWTKNAEYADYMERVIYNSLLAQNNNKTGVVSYFLPITGGGKKSWQTDTKDFSCCMGTNVQSNVSYTERLLYREGNEFLLAQYIWFDGVIEVDEKDVHLWFGKVNFNKDMTSMINYRLNEYARPKTDIYKLFYDAKSPVSFSLKVRIPSWAKDAEAFLDGKAAKKDESGDYFVFDINGEKGEIEIRFERTLRIEKMADANLYAFVHGPKVLAGKIDRERTLKGSVSDPETILRPYDENHWGGWYYNYYTQGQYENFPVVPLCDVMDDSPYTVYFPIEEK